MLSLRIKVVPLLIAILAALPVIALAINLLERSGDLRIAPPSKGSVVVAQMR